MLYQYYSPTMGKLPTWFRKDLLLFIEKGVMYKGKFELDMYRILPNTNDMLLVGHIDFSEHYYSNFEDAEKEIKKL